MQTKRRTAIEALTTEQQAFLHDGSQTHASSTHDAHASQSNHIKVAVTSAKASEPRRPASFTAARRRIRQKGQSNGEGRQSMQSVTLRLRETIARNLRNASIERSLRYQQPYTQQAITEAALTAWLERNGYSSDE